MGAAAYCQTLREPSCDPVRGDVGGLVVFVAAVFGMSEDFNDLTTHLAQ